MLKSRSDACVFRLYPRFGDLYPEGTEMLKKSDDADQVRASLEFFAVSYN
jgi:hypothetical protein